jgi:hypothetical protein
MTEGHLTPADSTDQPERPKLFTRRFTFRVRLDNEDWFFPTTAFAVTEAKAKAMVIDRFNGKIAEWK